MSERHDDRDPELALRDGLRRLPTPTPSAEFDAEVLAAFQRPRPWWGAIWQEARPLLTGAACSCAVTLAALSWSQQTPSAPRPVFPPPSCVTRPLDMAALDSLLNRSGLSAASLIEITPPAASAPSPNGPRLPTPPKRRVERLHAPLLA